MKDGPKRVTVKMIAEQAGTSIGTVDRALNNREGISAESRAAVLKVAQELGYRPNKFASALSRKKVLRIGIAYPTEPEAFYDDIDLGVNKAAEEVADLGVVIEKIRYQSQDPEIAYQRLVTIDPTAYDGLVINSSGPSCARLIDQFSEAGTPVTTFNTDAPESRRLFYIGNDSRQSGQVGGELLSMLLGGKGNITVLGNFVNIAPFIERFGGLCEYIQSGCPDIHLYPCVECNSDPEVAQGNLLELLELRPDIHGVFCTGYASTVGAINALKKIKRRDIHLVGYDVFPETVAALREGWCSALLYQNPYLQGYQGVRMLVNHLLDGWTPPRPRLHVDTRIVLRSNLESYVGQHSNFDFLL